MYGYQQTMGNFNFLLCGSLASFELAFAMFLGISLANQKIER